MFTPNLSPFRRPLFAAVTFLGATVGVVVSAEASCGDYLIVGGLSSRHINTGHDHLAGHVRNRAEDESPHSPRQCQGPSCGQSPGPDSLPNATVELTDRFETLRDVWPAVIASSAGKRTLPHRGCDHPSLGYRQRIDRPPRPV